VTADLQITGARVIDGSEAPEYAADVVVEAGTITAVHREPGNAAGHRTAALPGRAMRRTDTGTRSRVASGHQ
jgi:hypothetical protein